jgi:hypothetical protein
MPTSTQTSNLAEVKRWSILRLAIVLVAALLSTVALPYSNLLLELLSGGFGVPFMSPPQPIPIATRLMTRLILGTLLYGLSTLVLSLTISFGLQGLKVAAVGAVFAGLATLVLLTLDSQDWGYFALVVYELVAVSGIAVIILVATDRLRRLFEALPLLLMILGISWVTLTIGRSIWRQEVNSTGWIVTIQWCVGAWIWMSAVYWTEVAARRASWAGGIIWLALMPVPLILGRLWFHL